MMPGIDLILFDLNGVLYRYDRPARVAHLAQRLGLPAAAIQAAIWDSGFEDAGDTGEFSAMAYLDGFSARLARPLTLGDWLAALRQAVHPIPATLALLPRIAPGVRQAILTNNNLLVRDHHAKLYPALPGPLGAHFHVSAEFAARKPDPAAYRRCLARLLAEPARTLLIDDSAANISGAQEAGLQPWLYADPDALARELQRLNLLTPAEG